MVVWGRWGGVVWGGGGKQAGCHTHMFCMSSDLQPHHRGQKEHKRESLSCKSVVKGEASGTVAP